MSTAAKQGGTRWRHRAALVAFVMAPGVLLGGVAWSGGAALQQVIAHGQPCTPETVRAPLQNSFTVNVVNAKAKPGSGKAIATQLRLRDFTVGAVGNETTFRSVEGVGEIRYGRSGLDQALVVQKLLLPGAQLVSDFRAGTSVDLVLGPDFTALAAPTRPLLYRSQVTVNVYNTTYYEGLGRKVSQALTARGFAAGKVGLDPKNAWVQDIAAVRYGPDGDLAAELVQQQIPGSRLLLDPSIKGQRVDVLVGMRWRELPSALTVAPEPPVKPLAREKVTRPCAK